MPSTPVSACEVNLRAELVQFDIFLTYDIPSIPNILGIPVSVSACEVNLTADHVQFSSPVYVSDTGNVSCTYRLVPSKEGGAIGLSFESVNITGLMNVTGGTNEVSYKGTHQVSVLKRCKCCSIYCFS